MKVVAGLGKGAKRQESEVSLGSADGRAAQSQARGTEAIATHSLF